MELGVEEEEGDGLRQSAQYRYEEEAERDDERTDNWHEEHAADPTQTVRNVCLSCPASVIHSP